jgi:hypothetical protein
MLFSYVTALMTFANCHLISMYAPKYDYVSTNWIGLGTDTGFCLQCAEPSNSVTGSSELDTSLRSYLVFVMVYLSIYDSIPYGTQLYSRWDVFI